MGSFDGFKGVLPYASEIFGVYQPLLGWKSKRTAARYARVREALYTELAAKALANSRARVEVSLREAPAGTGISLAPRTALTVTNLEPLDLSLSTAPRISATVDSGVARLLARELGPQPPVDWTAVVNTDRITALLKKLQEIVTTSEIGNFPELREYVDAFMKAHGGRDPKAAALELFGRESKIAGYLLFLAKHTPTSLEPLFFATPPSALAASASAADPLLSFCLARVGLAKDKVKKANKKKTDNIGNVADSIASGVLPRVKSKNFPEDFVDGVLDIDFQISRELVKTITISPLLGEIDVQFVGNNGKNVAEVSCPRAQGEAIARAVLWGRSTFQLTSNDKAMSDALTAFLRWVRELDAEINHAIADSALGTGYETQLRSEVLRRLGIHPSGMDVNLPPVISLKA